MYDENFITYGWSQLMVTKNAHVQVKKTEIILMTVHLCEKMMDSLVDHDRSSHH